MNKKTELDDALDALSGIVNLDPKYNVPIDHPAVECLVCGKLSSKQLCPECRKEVLSGPVGRE